MSKTYSLDEIASDRILGALFATISFRLEPDGWATRFPLVLDHVQQGSLDVSLADQALTELSQIEAELKSLPPGRAVWSLNDLRVRNDSKEPVNHSARNLFEYFTARDGTPLLHKLRDIMVQCRSEGRTARIDSRVRRKKRSKRKLFCAAAFVICVALIVNSWHDVLTEHHYYVKAALSGPTGALLALAGCFIDLEDRRNRRVAIIVIVIGVALGALNWYLMDHYAGPFNRQ